MTYLRRAAKYFVQITIIFVLIIGILMLSGMVSKDVAVAFRNGWQSIWMILALFAAMSLAYPFFGYGKRKIHANGDPAPMWEKIDEALEARGYVFSGNTENGGRKYHLGNTLNRVAHLWEDTLTIESVLGGFEIEGLVRDLSRAVMTIDRKINDYGD
ncbi:MAG: hypothetical protein IJR12_06680 [Bacteroidales bacterium]|nr:hypothetical protein [Bacteroidales bacterium]